MRRKSILVIVGFALALLCVVIVSASDLTLDEASLNPHGSVYEVNKDAEGTLYISDEHADEIWRVEASGVYTVYKGVSSVGDAKPDAAGDIWWTDGAVTFGRISVPENTLTSWQVGIDHNLGGLAFDELGRVWLTEWFGYGSNLYRFDPASTELCTYTISLGSYSYYVLYDNGQLWLGHRGLGRIYRVDPAGGQATYWPITDSEPVGLALDGDGNLWWADQGLGALARLDPDANQVTMYTLPVPVGATPQMIAMEGNEVWYTESGGGTLGVLDPATVEGVSTDLQPGTTSVASTCRTRSTSGSYPVATDGGALEWTSGSATDVAAPNGWQVYQLSSGALPHGIANSNGYLWVGDRGNQKLLRAYRSVPGISLEKYTNGEDADVIPGPTIPVGEPVTWTYVVENSGDVDLTDVTVVDDNGTPTTADDYTCLIGGLAAGVVDDTTCSQTGTAEAGQYGNLAIVTASYNGSDVSDDDPSHYFGSNKTYIFLPLVLRNHTP